MNLAAPIAPSGRIAEHGFSGMVPRGDFKRAGGFAGLPELITRKGGDPSAILQKFGVDPRLLEDSETYLSYSSMSQAMEYCAKVLDSPFFGFELGLSQSPEVTGALAILLLASPTVEQGLSLVERYMSVHAPGARIGLVREGESVQLGYEILNSATAFRRQVLELSMVVAHKTMLAIAGPDFRLHRVDICADPPTVNSNRLEEFFGASVYYDQPQSSLHFPASFLAREIDSRNPTLLRLARSQCEALCPQEERLEDLVAAQIRRLLPLGGCNLTMVAKQLSVHPRTLQNRLLTENLEFRDILKNERRNLAESYLGSTRTPIAEIAMLLGYADQASFTRAFSSWLSMSPSKFRRLAHVPRGTGGNVQ